MPVDWNEFQPVTESKGALDWSQFSPVQTDLPPQKPELELPKGVEPGKPGEQSVYEEQTWMDKPILNLGQALLKQPSEAKSKTEAGILETLSPAIDSLTTPRNLVYMLGTLGIGATGTAGKLLMSSLWTGAMGKNAIQNAPEIYTGLGEEMAKPEKERDAKKIASLLTQSGLDAFMSIAPAVHAAGDFKIKPSTSEVTDAIHAEAAKVLQPVQEQPVEGPREVPVPEPIQKVGERGEPIKAAQSEVPLDEGRIVEVGRFKDESLAEKSLEENINQRSYRKVGDEYVVSEYQPETGPTTEVVKPETSEQTSLGITPQSPILSRIADFVLNPGESLKSIGTTLKGLGGYSLPKTTAAHSETGELGVRYASSRQAARPLAEVFASGTLVGTGVDPVKFGAALTEDNLRSVRKGFEDQAKDLLSKGDEEGAAAAVASAQQVHSLIGGKNSPFKTEADYQKYLEQPDVQQAVKQHIKQWEETIDPQFKAAQNIDPDVTLPTRGLQTGARINLKAILEDERGVSPVGSGGSLTATFKKKSPFGVAAKGTGQEYESNYGEIVHNTFQRQLEIANKNKFDQSLVSSGNAKIDLPGQTVTLDGERTTPFPLQRKVIITNKDGTTTTFNKNENIYVKNSLADEYRSASGVDKKYRLPGITPVMNVLNRAALAGLTDFTVHLSNQMTALFNRPVSGKLLTDSLLSVTGRADVPVTLAKAIFKSFKDNSKQIAELSEIGAMRDVSFGRNPLGKILGKTDQVTRLLLDDTFKSLVDQGLVENTETARREYVNQIGQYNRRLQGRLTRLARDTGFGPFATAGKTFNALGVKMVTLSPGAPSSGGLAEASLRANVLSKFVGATVLIGGINYLLTSNAGGGVMGRPGVPIGNLDTGKNDQNGNPLSIPLLDILGLGRGLRVTGIRGAAQSKYLGLPNEVALDAAARDIINSSVAPFAGPGPRFASVTATGSPIAVNVGRTAPVSPPGKNQLAVNFLAAAKDANPVVKSLVDRMVDGKSMREALVTQLPRFTLTSGKPPEMVENYPEIVHKAQLNAYLNDIVHRSRRMSPEKRDELIESTLDSLEGEDRLHAMRFFKYRRVQ